MNKSTTNQKQAGEIKHPPSVKRNKKFRAFVFALLTLMAAGAKLNAQNCVVSITQSPNTPLCAGGQVTLSASASAINIGTGADGALTVNSTYYSDATRAAVIGTNNGGTTKVRVASTAGFAAGDEVITITMIDSTGILAGQYEFNNISSISGDTLIFSQNHANTYNAYKSLKHQVVKVLNFTNVTVNSGGVLTCNAWNGSTGGVLCFRASGSVNVVSGGAITAAGKGFRGISHAAIYRLHNGAQGEGIYGQGYTGGASNGSNGTWNSANANGGGGGTGTQDAGGGGGGAYAASNSAGQASGSHSGGSAASTVGNASLTTLIMGGAGGEGGADEDGASPGAGGNGGGIIYITANSLTANGSVSSSGSNGGSGSNTGGGGGCGMAGGGGGAGGSIYMSLNSFSGTGTNITATGGAAGTNNGCGGVGGNGGYGRIRINMPGSIPVTNPAAYAGTIPSLTGVTFTWSNGPSSSSITVSPSVTTTYSAVITSTSGCTGSSGAITVTINPLPNISIAGTNTVCSGNPVTLTASGASTYSWTGGISNGVAFTPSVGNTYTVTGTNTLTGCSNTATISTSVFAKPTIAVSGGTICAGSSFTLNASGANTYTYSGGQVVSPSVTTAYSVTGTSAQGCVSQNTAVASIVVNQNPTIAASSGTICNGASFTLSASGANTYTYSGGQVVSPSVTTSYSVNGTSAQGCVSQNPAIVTVVVNQNPTVAVGGGTICAGNSFTLNASGANTYTYSGGHVVSPLVTTSYSVNGTSAQGCVSQNPAIVTVVVNQNPTVTVNGGTICAGNSFTLNASGANTYTYSGGQVVSPLVTTSYSVNGTSAQGCVSQNPAIVTVVVNQNPTVAVNGGTICAGDSFTLNASGANTYTYSGGQIVNPLVTTSYSVDGTSIDGCVSQNPAVVTVVVNQNPTVTVNGGTICAGNSFTLNASGANTYTYSGGQIVNPLVTTSYSVDGTSIDGCVSQNPAVVTVVVNQNPTVAVNGGTVCAGNSFTLNASGANTYTYSGGQVVNPLVTTSYSVDGTSIDGCVSQNPAIVTVVVNQNPTVTVNGGTICAGNSFTLNASGANTYTYSGGQIVNPLVTTSYSVDGTSIDGCVSQNPAIVTVVVNQNPTVSVTGGTICNGATFTLNASGANTYTYSGGQVVSPSVTTTYSVDGTSIDGCVSQSPAVVTIVVNPDPVITVTGGAICNGGSFTLNAAGANTYTYSGGQIVSPLVTTSYTVSGTSIDGCVSLNPAIVTVTVSANPTITVAGGTICQGQSFSFSPAGADSYTFSQGPVVTPSVTSTYTITGASQAGCQGDTVSATIIVNALPSLSLTAAANTVCVNQGSINLSGLPFGGVFSGVNVSDSVFTPVSQGVFTPAYSYTDAITGCSNTVTVSILVDNCTGLAKQAGKLQAISIYPNPNNGDFSVQTGNSAAKTITIIDLTGRTILSLNSAEETIPVNLKNFAKGIYSVAVNSDHELHVFRVVVD